MLTNDELRDEAALKLLPMVVKKADGINRSQPGSRPNYQRAVAEAYDIAELFVQHRKKL